MKKLTLKALELGISQVLSREQMKKVSGGNMALTCPSGCSAYVGVIGQGGGVQNGTCTLNTVFGQGGQTLTTCDCGVNGSTISGCKAPIDVPPPQ